MPPRDDMSSGVPMSGPPMSGPPMPGMDPNGPPGMYIRPSMPHYGGEPMPGVPQSPHGGPHGPPPHSLPPGHPMMNGPPPPQLGVPQPGMPPHPAATGMPGVSEWNLLDRLRVALNSCFFTSPFSLSTSTIAGSFCLIFRTCGCSECSQMNIANLWFMRYSKVKREGLDACFSVLPSRVCALKTWQRHHSSFEINVNIYC